MFNENSGLVQVWVRLIQSGAYSLENIPNLSNLQDIVNSIIEKENIDNETTEKAKAFDYLIEGENDNE